MSDANPTPQPTAPVLRHATDARGVHTLTLNTPKSFNALSMAMLQALQGALRQVAQDPGARVVVLAAEGLAFCAGHNLKEMRAHPSPADHQALFGLCTQVMLQIQKLPVPVIAQVQGLATAAGCQLVAQCDLAVAAESATFGVNGIDVGLFCATPSVPLARNIPAKVAMEMLLTGGFLSAQEAQARGLVNRVVSAADLPAAVAELVGAILNKPREAVAMGKAVFYQHRETGIEAAYQLAGQTMVCNLALDVTQEGIQAFAEKRPPAWRS